jgi:hypothetical protein
MDSVNTYFRRVGYRSRLEARWAVFLTVAGISFEYEPCKVGTSVGRYIPDFLLTFSDNRKCYVEIKPVHPTDDELTKIADLEIQTDHSCYIIAGNPESHIIIDPYCFLRLRHTLTAHLWQCPLCGYIGMAGQLVARGGEAAYYIVNDRFRLTHRCREAFAIAKSKDIDEYWLDWTSERFQPSGLSPLLALATQAAMSAKFESKDVDILTGLYIEAARNLRSSQIFSARKDLLAILGLADEYSTDPNIPKFDGFSASMSELPDLRREEINA